MTSNLLDILIMIILASSVVAGVVAGLARSGVGLLCAILGLLCGFWLYPIPAGWVHNWVGSMMLSNVLGFLIVFFPFVIAGGYAGRWVMRLFQRTGLGWLDRVAGAIFGFVRGALVAVAFVAVVLAFTSRPIPNWMVNSTLLPYAMTASGQMASLAPRELKMAFTRTVQEIREIWVGELAKSREEIEALRANTPKKKAK